MSDARYQVVPYSKDNLVAFFVQGGYASRQIRIATKPQIDYLHRYCTRLGIQALVYESEYVDRYFSDDYSGYYSKSFPRYSRLCKRVHFFATLITASAFEDLLLGAKFDNLSSNLGYRGFIVVKPLPQTVIGRTCLQAVGNSPDKTASFPPLTKCAANLFGMNLEVESLPFQEQDREVAACATSALWSALYATARAYQHAILSPLQITRAAISAMPTLSRSLPNDGLTVDHMIAVIRHLGLEIDLIDVSRSTIPLQAYMYAYLRGGIPLLLSFDFAALSAPIDQSEAHAVAVIGYDNQFENPRPMDTGFLLRATAINTFYVHDDRVGPFAPISVQPNRPGKIVTAWKDNRGRLRPANLDQLLIPLYPQIRTPFLPVLSAVMELDGIIEGLRANHRVELNKRLEWDLYIIQLDKLRTEILKDSHISNETKRDVVTESLPRFLWRATGYAENRAKVDLLFDATDLRQGKQCHRSILYDPAFDELLAAGLQDTRESQIGCDLTHDIIRTFCDDVGRQKQQLQS